jgi:hypothetical protein
MIAAIISGRGAGTSAERWIMNYPCLSHIALDENGAASFTDGRHRFAWMRDHRSDRDLRSKACSRD